MHLEKTERRSLRRILQLGGACAVSAAMVVTMAVPLASAANIGDNMYGMNPNNAINLSDGTSSVPSVERDPVTNEIISGDNPKSYDDYIIGGSGGSGTASMDYLDVVGIDMVGSLGYNWGTKINENPNSFVWNLAIDEFEGCPSLSGDAGSITDQIGFVKQGWSGTMTYATLVAYHPQVLAGSSTTAYDTMVQQINEAAGKNVGDEGYYDPVVINIAGSAGGVGISVFNDYLWDVSVATEAIDNYMDYDEYMKLTDQEKESYVTTRYGAPTETAQDYTGFFRGVQWYILSKVEGTSDMKTVAYVTGYDDGTVTMNGIDPTYTGASSSRPLEGLGQVVNWAGIDQAATTSQSGDVITYTTNDLSIFKDVDIVFTNISNGQQGGPGGGGGGRQSVMPLADDDDEASDVDKFHDAIKAQGFEGQFCESPSTAVGNQGFGLVRNQIEMIGYVYPDIFNISYGLKYFWMHFGHVKDEYAAAVMEDVDSNQLLPAGTTADSDGNVFDVSGYTESYFTDMIKTGQKYYLDNYDNANSNCSNSHLCAYGTLEASTHYDFNGWYDSGEAAKADGITASKLYMHDLWFQQQTGITPYLMEETLNGVLSDSDESKALIEDLEKKNSELNGQVSDLEKEKSDLETTVGNLQDDNADLEGQVESKDQTIEDLTTDIGDLNDKIDDLDKQISEKNDEIDGLQQKIDELNKELENAKNGNTGNTGNNGGNGSNTGNNGGGTKASAKAQTIKVAKKVTAKKGKKATIKVSGAKNALVAAGANAKAKKALKITVKGKTKVIVKAKKKGTFKVKIYAKASSSYKASAAKTVTVKVK